MCELYKAVTNKAEITGHILSMVLKEELFEKLLTSTFGKAPEVDIIMLKITNHKVKQNSAR